MGSKPCQAAGDKTPIIPLKDVRPGMMGYGLTVFRGSKIEAFKVEVVSVTHTLTPGRGAIWMQSPSPRMQKLGPAQGMSGSPIYLWRPNEPHILGKGGRLAGALAFGYGRTKGCYFGVRPIEQMRQVGQRADKQTRQQIQQAAFAPNPEATQRMLLQLRGMTQTSDSQTLPTALLETCLQLMADPTPRNGGGFPLDKTPNNVSPHRKSMAPFSRMNTRPHLRADFPAMTQTSNASASTLRLPIALGTNGNLIRLFNPLLQPLGLMAVQAPGGSLTSKPPAWIDAQAIKLEPGSTLAVPLAWGDADLAAIGTVTDVLPGGQILGFGHAMSNGGQLGIGTMNLPMATGFIHLIMPSRESSFKVGGSAKIVGTFVREENTAVVFSPQHLYTTIPLEVKINLPGLPSQTYHYEVARNPDLTPIISSILVLQSLVSVSGLPPENTLHLKATMDFQGNKQLVLDEVMAGASPLAALFQILPPIAAMTNNPLKAMPLTHAQFELNVTAQELSGTIIEAKLDQIDIAPGQTLGISLIILPHKKTPRRVHMSFQIPENLPDGNYPLVITGVQGYRMLMMQSHPHRLRMIHAQDLYLNLKRTMAIPSDRIYAVLQTHNRGLAIGSNELPKLPTSKQALYTNPTSTLGSTYSDWPHHSIPSKIQLRGSTRFMIAVRSELKNSHP